ncbi:hypothetical protein D3C76_1282840 [compost metagenome]
MEGRFELCQAMRFLIRGGICRLKSTLHCPSERGFPPQAVYPCVFGNPQQQGLPVRAGRPAAVVQRLGPGILDQILSLLYGAGKRQAIAVQCSVKQL